MKAKIDGMELEGTPQELAAFQQYKTTTNATQPAVMTGTFMVEHKRHYSPRKPSNHGQPWSTEEDQLLKERYEQALVGRSNAPRKFWKRMMKLLPGRTIMAMKARLMTIPHTKPRAVVLRHANFSPAEDEKIKEVYIKKLKNELSGNVGRALQQAIPERKLRAIFDRATYLGINKKKTEGTYMLRKHAVLPNRPPVTPATDQTLGILEEVKEFPLLPLIKKEYQSILVNVTKNCIANKGRMTYYNEGYAMGIDHRGNWTEFVSYFIANSKRISAYYGVPDLWQRWSSPESSIPALQYGTR